MIFENFGKSLKILEIHRFAGCPGWLAAGLSRGAKKAKKVMKSMRGGAVGVPDFRNMSGMMPVLSLPISTTIGGPKSFFGPGVQN